MTPYYCHDGMCGAEDCARCHPEHTAAAPRLCWDCIACTRVRRPGLGPMGYCHAFRGRLDPLTAEGCEMFEPKPRRKQ